MDVTTARASRVVARALARRCPNCGYRDLFESWYRRPDLCPDCGFDFEWEQGASLGAMAIDIPLAGLLFFGMLGGGLLLTWPDVPWIGLLVATVLVVGIFPAVFHPVGINVWAAIYIVMSRTEGADGRR